MKTIQTQWFKNVINNLAIKYKKDPRVIEYIIHYPFLFVQNIIRSEDERPIRLRHLGVFVLKPSASKVDSYNRRLSFLYDNAKEVVKVEPFTKESDVLEALDEYKTTENKDAVHKLYNRYKKLVKHL